MTTARAKGLRERVVVGRHVVRNALLPVVTILGYRIAFILSGTIVVETVFAWPGIGQLFFTSIDRLDYQVVQAIVLLLVDARRRRQPRDRSRLRLHRPAHPIDDGGCGVDRRCLTQTSRSQPRAEPARPDDPDRAWRAAPSAAASGSGFGATGPGSPVWRLRHRAHPGGRLRAGARAVRTDRRSRPPARRRRPRRNSARATTRSAATSSAG